MKAILGKPSRSTTLGVQPWNPKPQTWRVHVGSVGYADASNGLRPEP